MREMNQNKNEAVGGLTHLMDYCFDKPSREIEER